MRRDFEKFFVKLQLDYNAITKSKEDIDKEYLNGLLTDTQYNNFMTYYNSIKANYDRVNYVRYLLHKPPKFIDMLLNIKARKDAHKELNKFKELNADEESVLNENKDAINSVNKEFNK